MRIGVVSDTHGHWDSQAEEFFSHCDAILHAGDIGGLAVAGRIANFRKLYAVSGNIDDATTRLQYPLELNLELNGTRIYMTHIGGYAGKLPTAIRNKIGETNPHIFICGHSHILRVGYDQKSQVLCINPGAYGLSGFHTLRTAVRLEISDGHAKNLEVLEMRR